MFSKFALEQPISCKVLNNVFINKHFSHAYLFETNGYDKGYNMALTFAKAILCPYDFSKCSTCNQCKMIDENNYPELKIIDESDNWIKKENLINLQEEFKKYTKKILVCLAISLIVSVISVFVDPILIKLWTSIK